MDNQKADILSFSKMKKRDAETFKKVCNLLDYNFRLLTHYELSYLEKMHNHNFKHHKNYKAVDITKINSIYLKHYNE